MSSPVEPTSSMPEPRDGAKDGHGLPGEPLPGALFPADTAGNLGTQASWSALGKPVESLPAHTDALPPLAPPLVRNAADTPGDNGGEIAFAEPKVGNGDGHGPPKQFKGRGSDVPLPHAPALAAKPLWPMPEEARGRSWLAVMIMLVLVGLYGWMLSFYYAGAHGGVDQAGYLMTARLIAGEYNPDAPERPAIAANVPAIAPAATGPASTAPAPFSIWPGSEAGYTNTAISRGDHPAPSAIQNHPRWDWLRNRMSFVPESPFQFASRMCIITEPYGPAIAEVPAVSGTRGTLPGNRGTATRPGIEGKPAEYRVFAKYPFGYPLVAAVGRTVAGWFDDTMVATLDNRPGFAPPATLPRATTQAATQMTTQATTQAAATTQPAVETGATEDGRVIVLAPAVGRGFSGMYIVNPLCTVLACFFAYFMFRQAVSPFMALIGVLWLACNPLTLIYANDANSHASTLFFVCAGFWALISLLRTAQVWRAWIAGLMLGYACTIRYSEFLLILPVIFVAAVHFRFTWKRAIGSLSLLAAWAIPVAILAGICWISFGSPLKTGYTYCNEDTGFGWKYLSGDWGDRQVVGNWETLVTQINRTGMFLFWPLALAGMFGLIGTAWRLGGIIGLWVMPSIVLYMLYYWAPGGELTTGYLRFIASIVPGLVFAGIWMIERALTSVKADKWPALVMGTFLGLALLLLVAFYADGGPNVIDGGLGKMILGFLKQTPGALWHLLTASVLGAVCFIAIVLCIAGMWIFDRRIIGARMGVVLGAGVLTALGCAVNVFTVMPQLETTFGRWTVLRATVDNLREVLPRGSVVFCDDGLLNQLDCVGGWKLYNTSLFAPAMYTQSKIRVDQRNAAAAGNNADRVEDPDPIQPERSRFYMELLSQPSTVSRMALGSRSLADIQLMQKAVIDREMAAGHRVTFLVLDHPGDMGGGTAAGARVAIIPGYERRPLRKWIVSPLPTNIVGASPAAAFGARTVGTPVRRPGAAGARAAGGIVPNPPVPTSLVPPAGATYVLYELVKAK